VTTALDRVLALAAQQEQFTVDEAAARAAEEEDARQTTELVEAAGAGLSEACRLLTGADLSSCPPVVLEAVAAVYASACALGGLDLPADNDWVEATALDVTALMLAGDGDGSKPYGDVPYADPGYQKDGKKRYPITKEHIRAAIAYFSRPSNRESYSPSQVKAIWGRIKAAASKFGIDMSDSTVKAAGLGSITGVLELAAGGPRLSERLIKNHPRFHGGHEHDHMHLNDNRHGPAVAGFAAGNNTITAFNHPPMTGMHVHAHVHAGDATHGPMRAHDDDEWG
jgi:hypothetical protein